MNRWGNTEWFQKKLIRVDELYKDAKRYRWLRHGDNDDLVLKHYQSGEKYLPRNEALDKAIDAAIEKERG